LANACPSESLRLRVRERLGLVPNASLEKEGKSTRATATSSDELRVLSSPKRRQEVRIYWNRFTVHWDVRVSWAILSLCIVDASSQEMQSLHQLRRWTRENPGADEPSCVLHASVP
jgi:hypothetical protein